MDDTHLNGNSALSFVDGDTNICTANVNAPATSSAKDCETVVPVGASNGPHTNAITDCETNNDDDASVHSDTTGSESFGILESELADLDSFGSMDQETSTHATNHLLNPQKGADHLCIHSLMRMTPLFQGRDVVQIAARHLLVTKIKSQKPVSVFFPDHQSDMFERLVDNDWFDFETFAVLYVCQTLSKCNDPYDLCTLIDGDKINQHIKEITECLEWKKVGFALYTTIFPELVKDSETCIPFSAYMNSDRKHWARKMYEMLRDSAWQYSVIHPVVTGHVTSEEYNRDMNILCIKIHLLDPTLVMPAFHLLQKALPDLNLEIATTNYLGGPLDCSLIKKEVETVVYKPMYPRNVSRLSLGEVEVYYGVEVLEFVMLEPRELELLTQNIPDNRRTTTLRDRCVVM